MIVTFVRGGSLISGTADLQMSMREDGRLDVWSDALSQNCALAFMPQEGARYREWFAAVAWAIGYGDRTAVFKDDTSIKLLFGGGLSVEIHASGECWADKEPFHVARTEEAVKHD